VKLLVLLAAALSLAAASLSDARSALHAGRYAEAAEIFRSLTAADPSLAAAHEGLVRALIADERAGEAYTAAEAALAAVPETVEAHNIAGLVAFRKGRLGEAERAYRAALQLDRMNAVALMGVASINAAVLQFSAAFSIGRMAYRSAPHDPIILGSYAMLTHESRDHLAVLEKALGLLDAESKPAKRLRPHVAVDRALAGRNVPELESPYEPAQINLVRIQGPDQPIRGFGVKVRINDKKTMTLLLDTGASGITLFRGNAEGMGMERVAEETSEARGIGSGKPGATTVWVADRVQIGSVVMRHQRVRVLSSKPQLDEQGIIGSDVFEEFLVVIDHPRSKLILEPHPDGRPPRDKPVDAGALKPGFHKFFRFGHLLLIPVSVNRNSPVLFLVDTGAGSNGIDADAARQSTGVSRDHNQQVRGIQGKVDKVFRADRAELAFAGLRQTNRDLISFDLDATNNAVGVEIAGFLGMPVLSVLKLTIDYRNGGVRFDYK
jgi:predicted aspartyl protease